MAYLQEVPDIYPVHTGIAYSQLAYSITYEFTITAVGLHQVYLPGAP